VKEESVILLADVGNLYHCATKKWPGRRLDYSKLLEEAKKYGEVFRSIAYGTQKEEELAGFITALNFLGYETKFKTWRNNRTSWNTGIAIDLVRYAKPGDTVCIASSDPDLVDALLWARDTGIKCIVISVGISRPLKNAAYAHFELGEEVCEPLSSDS
jgi:uncharacterized LabA/DUF88 family protein